MAEREMCSSAKSVGSLVQVFCGNYMSNHLLSLWDFDKQQLYSYIRRALQLKKEAREGVRHHQLDGKVIGLIFEKPSTRTRVSFESAMYGLGGQVIYLSGRDTQLARNEPLKDMARVMARYVDGMVVRTFGQEVVDELGRYSTVPVINALTDLLPSLPGLKRHHDRGGGEGRDRQAENRLGGGRQQYGQLLDPGGLSAGI